MLDVRHRWRTMRVMSDDRAFPFPWPTNLTGRHKSQVVTYWKRFWQLQGITKESGMLVPLLFSAKLLHVSWRRVRRLIGDGLLEGVDVCGHHFVTGNSIERYARTERKRRRHSLVAQQERPKLAQIWQRFRELQRVAEAARLLVPVIVLVKKRDALNQPGDALRLFGNDSR